MAWQAAAAVGKSIQCVMPAFDVMICSDWLHEGGPVLHGEYGIVDPL